jgi:hypothetical protein
MLASITPLGERGRNSRWWLTVSAHLVGSALAGALLGGLLGLAGTPLPDGSFPLVVVAALAVVGALLDLGIAGTSIPTIHRQVDEGWLDQYRGWVYGAGFGFQLGLGVTTVVTTAAVYVTWAVALLSGSWLGGLVVGLAFGVARGLVPLTTRRIHRPEQLWQRHRRIAALERPARRLAVAAQIGVALLAVVVVSP